MVNFEQVNAGWDATKRKHFNVVNSLLVIKTDVNNRFVH